MSVRNLKLLAALLILTWPAPHAVAMAVHVHEVHSHGHHQTQEDGLSVHAESHVHEMPSLDRDVAPPARSGKQRMASTPQVSVLPPVPLPAPRPAPAALPRAAARCAPPGGPPLVILHCSFLI